MPLSFGTDNLICGYFGNDTVISAYLGDDLVCSSSFLPHSPSRDDTGKRVIIDYRSLGYPYSVGDFVRSTDLAGSDWYVFKMNNPSSGQSGWERFTSLWRLKWVTIDHNRDRIIDISVFKATEYNNTSKTLLADGMYAFLPNLKTVQYRENTGSLGDAHYAFKSCHSLEYIGLRPQNFSTRINMQHMFWDLPSLKLITYLDTTNAANTTPMWDSVTKNSLIRPSLTEQQILERKWGGLFNYNASNGKSGVQRDCPKGKAFIIDNMAFTSGQAGNNLAIAQIELIDDKGERIMPDKTLASSELSIHVLGRMFDSNYSTFWHNDAAIEPDANKVFLRFEFDTEVSLSQIAIRARDSVNSKRTFIRCDISVCKDIIDTPTRITRWAGAAWAAGESRSILLTTFKG